LLTINRLHWPIFLVLLLDECIRQRSVPVNTIKSYAHDLRLFVQAAPADLPQVSAETFQAFLASFDHLSAATRRRRYSTLCAFYHWLIRHGVAETNPMERLDPMEQVEREPRPLQPETVRKILQAIPTSNLRDRTLLTLTTRYFDGAFSSGSTKGSIRTLWRVISPLADKVAFTTGDM
jgi:site-specific recombinase XerD